MGGGLVGCRQLSVESEHPPSSVVLVTIDTLRADHLGSYGYPREVSPFLDTLAEGGLRFENVISPCPHTAPAHASILTSLQPFQHGLVKNGQGLPSEFETLGELFKGQGYDTAGFASVGFLSELRRGFDTFRARWGAGDQTVDSALSWLSERGDVDKPFFLWLHLYDPHALKGPRENLREDVLALQEETSENPARFVEFLVEQHGIDPTVFASQERLLQRYNTYDAGIRFADRQIERLYRQVQSLDPETLWVITSDHGEGMGNHAYVDHGRYLYSEQIEVPLILYGPGLASSVVPRLVRLVDIYPTLAEWLGVPEASSSIPSQGYSLFSDSPKAEGPLSPRVAFTQRRPKDGAKHRQRWEDGEVRAVQTLRHKYISRSSGEDEFFDLELDPWELENLVGDSSKVEESLRQLLERYFSTAGRSSPDPSLDSDLATEHDEELRALGYL